MEKNGDPHGSHSFYVNFSEDIWHRGWLLRGETEKALLAFYSMLAYGVDKQTFATVERFHLTDDRYAPFFMDTSANARVCGLIRQALILEEGKMLYLLLGVPRRWLEDGKQIEIAKGITTVAKIDLKVKSHLQEGKILIGFTLADLQAEKLKGLRLRVPHPARQQMKKVLVNGQPWTRFNSENEIIELTPGNGRTEIVVSY
jgi:hypothetical protein